MIGTSSQTDTVYASKLTLGLNSAQAFLMGGGDTVYTDGASSDALTVTGTNGKTDSVNASGGALGLINAQSGLIGSSDTVYFEGDDALYSEGNSQTLVFGSTMGDVTISGFNSSDVIQLSKSDFSSWQALRADISQTAQGAEITLESHNQILLLGVQALSLVQSAFKLV